MIHSEHQWFYLKQGMIGDETIGPFDEPVFIAKIEAGELNRNAVVSSPSRTKAGWVDLGNVPDLLEAWKRGDTQRAIARENDARNAKALRQAKLDEQAQARQIRQQVQAQQAAERDAAEANARIEEHRRQREHEEFENARERRRQQLEDDPAWQLRQTNELLLKILGPVRTIATILVVYFLLSLIVLFFYCAGGPRLSP